MFWIFDLPIKYATSLGPASLIRPPNVEFSKTILFQSIEKKKAHSSFSVRLKSISEKIALD